MNFSSIYILNFEENWRKIFGNFRKKTCCCLIFFRKMDVMYRGKIFYGHKIHLLPDFQVNSFIFWKKNWKIWRNWDFLEILKLFWSYVYVQFAIFARAQSNQKIFKRTSPKKTVSRQIVPIPSSENRMDCSKTEKLFFCIIYNERNLFTKIRPFPKFQIREYIIKPTKKKRLNSNDLPELYAL